MRQQRIVVASLLLLASVSCGTQPPIEPGQDPYAGEYALFAHAPSTVRITRDNGLLLQNGYSGSNPWLPAPGAPIPLTQHSPTQFSHDNVRIEFGRREHGRFHSMTMSSVGPYFQKVDSAAAATTSDGDERFVGRYRLQSNDEAKTDDEIEVLARNGRMQMRRRGGPLNPLTLAADDIYIAGEGAARLAFQARGKIIQGLRMLPPPEHTRQLVRTETLLSEYLEPQPQHVYLEHMRNHMAAGQYTLSRFNSPSRGPVDFAVYLPPDWRPDAKDRYPLIFFLHGQDGSEHGFPYVVPATQLNSWIKRELIPPFVLIALRSGRLGTIEEQWSTTRNESLLTSFAPDELRTFALKHFKAGASPETTSIHGHSRGALGALHFALKYPHLFASSVSNSMVSDYAFPEEAANAQLYAPNVIASGIRYRISIGDADQFTKELGRRISADTHDLLGRLGIEHEYEILSGVAHDPREVWSYRRANNTPNGLYELRFHARAWGD